MLNVKEKKDGTIVIDTGKKAKHPKIDWKGMLGGKLPAPELMTTVGKLARSRKKEERRRELLKQITVKRWAPGSISNATDDDLIKGVEERLELASGKITGREDFELVYPRAYQELCRRTLQEKIWPEKKQRQGKYEGKSDEELLADAAGFIENEKPRNAKEFSGKHRFLYNNLSEGGKKKLGWMIEPDLGNAGELYIGEDFSGIV